MTDYEALVEKAQQAAFRALEDADWDEIERVDGDLTRGLAALVGVMVLDAVAADVREDAIREASEKWQQALRTTFKQLMHDEDTP